MTPVREALETTRRALIALRTRLKTEPAVQGRGWVDLGIVLNNAVDEADRALSAAPGEPCAWRFEVQHGPDGQTDYAWVYDEKDNLVCTTKTHFAQMIVARTSPQPAAGWDALRANLREAWSALALIRETVETLGPVGAMPAAENLDGPTFMHEAEAIVQGIQLMTLRREAPALAEGVVERVLSELRDRRLLNDVDDDLHREIAIALIKAAEPILAPAECNCDDPDCPKRHWSLTLRQAYENAIARLREAEAGLRSWEITAKRISEEETRQSTCDQCPKCGGDCSAANPPVYDCPMVGCNKDF